MQFNHQGSPVWPVPSCKPDPLGDAGHLLNDLAGYKTAGGRGGDQDGAWCLAIPAHPNPTAPVTPGQQHCLIGACTAIAALSRLQLGFWLSDAPTVGA